MLTLSLFTVLSLYPASSGGVADWATPRTVRTELALMSSRPSSAQQRLRQRRSQQRERVRGDREEARPSRPYRWQDSYDADYRRAQQQRDAARESRRAESEARRAAARPYRWEDSYGNSAVPADRRDGNRPQGDWGYALGGPTHGSTAPRTIQPAAPHPRSSVCGNYTGSQRVACLQAEVRRGQANLRGINLMNDALAGATAGTCAGRKVMGAIEQVGTGVMTGIAKGAKRITARRLAGRAAVEAGGEATGVPTTAVQGGALVGDTILRNGGCTPKVR
jgi:hypothetical protein